MLASELREIPFLAAVPETELEPWAGTASTSSLPRRSLLEADAAEPALHFLTRGLLMLHTASRDGDLRITGIVDPSQCFNIHCIHPGLHPAESAHAITDAEIVSVPAQEARAAVRRGGTLAALLCGYAAGRLAELTDDLVRATTLDVRARTAVSLLRLSDRMQTSNIPLTQEQLSSLVGTRRETLALILGALRNEEVVDTRYRMIKILDRARLQQAARNAYPSFVDYHLPAPLTGESCLR